MKHFFLIYIIFVAYHQNLFSQHEFSIGLGGANYYGDLNKANSQTPVSLLTDFNANAIHGAASIGYRYNFPEFFSFGIDFSTMTVSGWDADNNTTGLDFFRHRRNLHFFSNVTDAGLTLNYEPLRNGQAKPEYFVSPYVGAGIGAFMFDPRANYLDNEIYLKDLGTEGQNTSNPERKYSNFQVNIPAVMGVKVYDPSRQFSLGFEMRYRFTFTDYLDDVSHDYVNKNDFNTAYDANTAAWAIRMSDRTSELSQFANFQNPVGDQRGNPNNNDAYFTFMVKFSMLFFQKYGKDFKCFDLK